MITYFFRTSEVQLMSKEELKQFLAGEATIINPGFLSCPSLILSHVLIR